MIYISSTGSFDNPSPLADNDGGVLVKVQIENSIGLGWKLEDILLITNFDFQYGPVKAIVLKDVQYFEPHPKASKINAIIKLFEESLINDNQVYWFHDLDAFQTTPLTEYELKLGKADLGLTAHNDYKLPPALIKNKQWSTGSIFFKKSSKDIFYHIKEIMYDHEPNEEKALTELTQNHKSISKRVKRLNHTYNFVAPIAYKYGMTNEPDKPIKVVHYHPYGFLPKSREGIPLIPDRLERIFSSLGMELTKPVLIPTLSL